MIFDYTFFVKLILFVLVPIIIIVISGSILINKYSKEKSNNDKLIYNCIMDYYSSLLAVVVVGLLFGITCIFSIHFGNTMKVNNLITGNEIIFYIIVFIPMVPLTFLVYYVKKMLIALSRKKEYLNNKNKK